MNNQITFSAAARKDIEQSFNWYEEQTIGIGDYFLGVIKDSINIISLNPEIFPIKNKNRREMIVNKFPFIIIYEIRKDNVIRLLRVFHTSRNPNFKYRRK